MQFFLISSSKLQQLYSVRRRIPALSSCLFVAPKHQLALMCFAVFASVKIAWALKETAGIGMQQDPLVSLLLRFRPDAHARDDQVGVEAWPLTEVVEGNAADVSLYF